MSASPRSRVSLSFRLGVTAAAAVLLTAGCLTPLVSGARWYLDVAVAVGVVAGCGILVRELTRWRLPVVVAQLAALATVVTVLFARDSALAGLLPTSRTVEELRGLVDQGVEITREQAPPVEAHPGVLLLVVAGLGLVAVATDAVAATWRRPALAGLPLLAVYCVPAAVLADGLAWPWFLLAACGFLLLVAADSSDRVRAWGRMVNAGTGAALDRVRLGVMPGSSGVRAGGVALVAALAVPLAVPALGRPLFEGTGLGDGEGTGKGRGRYVNPILDLRQNLTERSDDVALRMRLDSGRVAPLLRIAADETFDGTTWSPRTDLPPESNQVAGGLPGPPGLEAAVPTTQRRVDIQIGTLDQSFLPLPYPTTRVEVAGDWRYNSATLDVVGRGVRTAGLSYSAEYLELAPTSQQLLDGGVPGTLAMQPFLRLPPVPDDVARLADEIAGDGTPYQQAVNLQSWFRTFQYSTRAPGNGRNDASLDVMSEFLRVRQGYCVHFASAMAVMARLKSIPSRVAVGFLPPAANEDGTYEVTFARAHAWPELYFRNIGWVRFEPTPPSQSGQPPSWTIPRSGQVPNPNAPRPPVTATNPDTTATAAPQEQPGRGLEQVSRGGGVVSWWWALLLLLPGVALVPGLLARILRRRAWARARTPVGQAETAWSFLRTDLGALGSAWPTSATPRQVRRLLTTRHGLSDAEDAALARLVDDLETARYVPDGASSAGRDVRARREDVELVRRGVARLTSRGRRWRGVWLPPARPADPVMTTSFLDSTSTESDRVPVGAGRR